MRRSASRSSPTSCTPFRQARRLAAPAPPFAASAREATVSLPCVEPVEALERIGHLLERAREPTYRVRAFRGAAAALNGMSVEQIQKLADENRLRTLPGVGPKTERVIREALGGQEPEYMKKLLSEAP